MEIIVRIRNNGKNLIILHLSNSKTTTILKTIYLCVMKRAIERKIYSFLNSHNNTHYVIIFIKKKLFLKKWN